MQTITKQQARRFVLAKQGLYGDYRFVGKQGAYAYILQAGCIQFDPIHVVGRNAELTLQSRVKGFRKQDLADLLYQDRLLFDYFDKEMAIIPTVDWPYFRRDRDHCRKEKKQFTGIEELEAWTLNYIREHGPVSSSTLPLEGTIAWHSALHWSGDWSGGPTKASRSVLEQLYTTGDLVIHHKEGSRKFYDLAERHMAEDLLHAEEPLPNDYDRTKWGILRRIGAVGLLWNKNSTAFLGIAGRDPKTRNQIFEDLLGSDQIRSVQVEGISVPLYYRSEDQPLLDATKYSDAISRRCEFLAPLDPMLWDRALVETLFDFTYSWEIYVPKEKRKYGYYVLPLLYGDRLIGRIEPVIREGKLHIAGLWLEPGIRRTKKLEKAIISRLKKFARFNEVPLSMSETPCLWE